LEEEPNEVTKPERSTELFGASLRYCEDPTMITVLKLCKMIDQVPSSIPNKEWEEIKRTYAMTWAIVYHTILGLVKPTEKARPRLEDLYRVLKAAQEKFNPQPR
jgi:hypothetical protein